MEFKSVYRSNVRLRPWCRSLEGWRNVGQTKRLPSNRELAHESPWIMSQDTCKTTLFTLSVAWQTAGLCLCLPTTKISGLLSSFCSWWRVMMTSVCREVLGQFSPRCCPKLHNQGVLQTDCSATEAAVSSLIVFICIKKRRTSENSNQNLVQEQQWFICCFIPLSFST